jgi:hypothetical protein
MENKKISICFIGANPKIDGGITNYQRNLIKYIKSKERAINITWVYKSQYTEKYSKDNINYVGLKVRNILFIDDFIFNKKIIILI